MIRSFLLISALLILISAYDLFSPPLSSTSWRQTQTAMLTRNLVQEGFLPAGLYVDFMGLSKPLMLYEFPIYNYLVGFFHQIFGFSAFWGKLVSLICAVVTLSLFMRLVCDNFGTTVAVVAGLFLILTPIHILLRTSYQPDSLGMMFLFISLFYLIQWTHDRSFKRVSMFFFFFSFASLTKYPLVVPYIPLILLLFFFGKDKHLRIPRFWELVVGGIVVVIPVSLWYLHFVRFSHHAFLEGRIEMFFLGDLARFASLGFYLKPAFIFVFYLFSLSGVIFLLAGIMRSSRFEVSLLIGIPLYLILVPTAAEQHYYQFAVAPITAIFMAKGWFAVKESLGTRAFGRPLMYASLVLYFVAGFVATSYLLRHDTVFASSSAAVKQYTKPDELILSLALHDRVYVGAQWAPELFYLSERKGWNLTYREEDDAFEVIKQQIEERKKQARYLVITWYTRDLEPWFVNFISPRFARNPRVDGHELFGQLSKIYEVLHVGDHFAILLLS